MKPFSSTELLPTFSNIFFGPDLFNESVKHAVTSNMIYWNWLLLTESKNSDRIWFTINIDNRSFEFLLNIGNKIFPLIWIHTLMSDVAHGPLTSVIYHYIRWNDLSKNESITEQSRASDEFITCMTSLPRLDDVHLRVRVRVSCTTVQVWHRVTNATVHIWNVNHYGVCNLMIIL